jgi:diadenosine tetraphosphate (Ap4A) HIT family hydrolase
MKRDRDDTDFRGVDHSYGHRAADCIFCELKEDRIVAENALCVAIRDAFPVTEGHTIIIPKRHVADYFELYQPELNAITALLHQAREAISKSNKSVSGFNVGVNSGEDAGQTIFHCHVHLIPRRHGDTENPRGGVRGVISARQHY